MIVFATGGKLNIQPIRATALDIAYVVAGDDITFIYPSLGHTEVLFLLKKLVG